MNDAFANFPFLPEPGADLTFNSFLSGGTEDRFTERIWRLRRWGLYGNVTLENSGVGNGIYDIIDISDPAGAGYIFNGENAEAVTSAFISLDDILEFWRKTKTASGGDIIDEGTGEESPRFDIWWGPRGTYDLDGGRLDSELFVEKFPNGDEFFQLSTNPDRITTGDYRVSDAFLTFDPAGDNNSVTLYESDAEFYAFFGEFVLIPGGLYWPWTIAGDPTYDTASGAQLRNPLRRDTNGSPLIYFSQQT